MTAGTPIWFCATGKSGLGHLRRVTNIASAIKFNTPRRPLALMTNAPVAGLSEREQSCFSEIKITSRDAMSRELQESKTGPIVVDTAVLPGLAEIDVPLCLILREIKTSKLERFRLAKNRMWDLVIVPNPVDQWQPDTTVLPARRVENVGWIFRTEVGKDNVNPTHSESYNQSIAKILVASGGGGSTDTQYKFCETVTCLIEAVQQRTESLFKVTQAIGPRADDRAVIAGVDEIVKPGSTLNKMFAQADIVISTAGYNSVLELANTDVPTLLIPARRTYDDQSSRACHWGPCLGLAHSDLERSAQWITHLVDKPMRRPQIDIESSGASVAADLVGNLAA